MEFDVTGPIRYWRGPAPWYFVTVPPEESAGLRMISNSVTYGWGVIPVTCRMGGSRWTTSLFPKDGLYLVPIKAAIRRAEGVDEGDEVRIYLSVG